MALTEIQAQFVEQMVAAGQYQNASEGLRLVQAREAERATRLAALDEAVAIGAAEKIPRTSRDA